MPEFNPDKHYWGVPCKRGHSGMRYLKGGGCPECIKIKFKERYWFDPERHRKRSLKDKWNRIEKHRENSSKWNRDNSTRVAMCVSARRAKQKIAVPKWYEEDAINILFAKAKELGSHVDHIVPITSDLVCGLHCWDNLQVLPPEENQAKCNYYWPNMPGEDGDY